VSPGIDKAIAQALSADIVQALMAYGSSATAATATTALAA
jgi:hypothetical protein